MKMKRFISFLCVFSLIVSLLVQKNVEFVKASTADNGTTNVSGDIQPLQIHELSKEEADKVPEYTANATFQTKAVSLNSYASSYGYEQLENDTLKTIYLKLEDAFYSFQDSNDNASQISFSDGTVGYVSPNVVLETNELLINDLYKVMVPFFYDHPELFWSDGYSYVPDGSYVDSILFSCDSSYQVGSNRVNILNTIKGGIETYLDSVKGLNTDAEKELAIHDAMVNNLAYQLDSNGNPSLESNDHTIEGVFTDHTVVCEGYAKAFQLLMNACGIQCIYIAGLGDGGGHAWNMVQLDSEWYDVDVTWDDPVPNGTLSHDWFNKTDSQFANHTPYTMATGEVINYWCYDLPVCTATTYNYNYVSKMGITKYQLNYNQMDGFQTTVFNNGVEVDSGSFVEAGTAFTIVVTPIDQSIQYNNVICNLSGESKAMTESTDSETGEISYTLWGTMPAGATSFSISYGSTTQITYTGIQATYKGQSLVVGSIVNKADISVTASYSDGSTKTINSADFIISPETVKAVGNNLVTVTYLGKTTTVNITGLAAASTNQTVGSTTATQSVTSDSTTPIIITVGKTSLKIYKRKTAKSVYIKWKKISGVSGYEITYAKTSSGSGAKKKIITGNRVSVTLSGLTKLNAKYVKIRAYKKVNGKMYYGAWTKYTKIK